MKGRSKRATGGVNTAAEDLKTNPARRNADAEPIFSAAEERKRGGRARKSGGMVPGKDAECRSDRKPRKSGGRAGSNANPFSSARSGTSPVGHKVESVA